MAGGIKATARFALQGAPAQGTERILGYRQFQVYSFIKVFFAEHGKPPIYEQICEGAGVGTHGEVSRIITGLERRPSLGIGREGTGRNRRITLRTANLEGDGPVVEA